MSVIIESDLKEILNKIDQRLDKLDTKIDNLGKEIDQRVDKLDTKIDNLGKEITDLKVGVAKLDEKFDGLAKRMDNQEFISRGVLIGLIVAILGGFAKLFGIVGGQ